MPAGRRNDDGYDAEDGIVHRLAKTLFANPNSPFTAFADRQRMDRIEQCKELGRVLEACRSARHAGDAARGAGGGMKDAPDDVAGEIPTSRSGARIARFFKWDDPPPGPDGGGDDGRTAEDGVLDRAVASLYDNGSGDDEGKRGGKDDTRRPRFSEDCAIETHELWACRALALGCGNHLADLRRCWSDQHSVATVKMRDEGTYFYEAGAKEETSCRAVQMSMARCVNRHAEELNERVRASRAGEQ
jgi:hypothetical protein